MEIQEVKIEMEPGELVSLRNYLLKHGSEALEPQEIQEVSPGLQREPILISLIVALGGPVIVKELASLLKEWMRVRQEERMKKAELEHKERIHEKELDHEEYRMELEALEKEEFRMKLSVRTTDGSSSTLSLGELELQASA